MLDEQKNIFDLPNEKLRLEIEELKVKIWDQRKTKVWENYVKPIIPVVVTLIIGIWGTILTRDYNNSQLENAKTQLTLAREKNKSDKDLSLIQLEISKRKYSSDSSNALTQLQINLSKNESDKMIALTQLEIAKRKNESDKAIAQISASLSFVKLLQDIPSTNKDLIHQAKTVIAPVLPIETSFSIAINELPDNPNVLEVLFRTYKNETWKYLTPFIEIYPLKYSSSGFWNAFNQETVNRFDLSGTDSLFHIIEQKRTFYKNENVRQLNNSYSLFQFLNNYQLLSDFYKYLISSNYKSTNRVFALINYFDYISKVGELIHNPSLSEKLSSEIATTIEKLSDNTLKSDLSLATSIVFDKYHSNTAYSELAAKYYWEKFDVSIGESPSEGSLYQYIYEKRFHSEDIFTHMPNELNSIQILSNSLLQKLSSLNFSSFDVDRITVICYSYCETSLIGSKNSFTPYLKPNQTCQFITKVLKSLNTEKRKQEFSMHLGSLSGDILFRNISQDSIIGKKYAELLISWYRENWKSGWYIPKFFSSITEKYPELKTKMDKKWGIWID